MTATFPLIREPSSLVTCLMDEHLPPPAERRRLRKAVKSRLRHIAHELKVSETAVSYWERGICDPGPRHRRAYREILDDFAELERRTLNPMPRE